MSPKARSRASSTRYGDIRILLVTTNLACGIPDFASLNPGYLLKAGEPRRPLTVRAPRV